MAQSQYENETCLTFGPPGKADLVSHPGATWADLARQFPEGWAPECVILDLAYTRVPDGIWAAPVPIVGLAGDWNLLWHAYQYLVPRCDLILTDTAGVERLAAAGNEHARAAFLYGIEPEYYEPAPDAPERDIDVLFVGNLHPAVQRERHPWLARLAALAERRNVVIRTGTFGPEYRSLLRRAKIVFNRSIRGELNRRTVEAAAAGALVFQEAGNLEAPAAFRDRKECVYYTADDLEPLLDHYLTHDAGREAIATAGKVAADAFRADRAWDRILSTIRENEPLLTALAAQRAESPLAPSLRGRVWAALGESERSPDPTLTPALSAAASNPDRPGVDNLLGVAVAHDALQAGTGERSAVQAAATAFRQAVQADSTNPIARLNLAEALSALGHQDEAVRELRVLLGWLAREVPPADPEAWDAPPFPPTFELFRVEWERAGWTHASDPTALLDARRALVRWRANLLLAQETDSLPAYYEAVLA
ncbi:MAG TPA: glycosyltransferase, partial [Gemmata sp.]